MLPLYLTLVKPLLKCCAPGAYVFKKYAEQMERRQRTAEGMIRHLENMV